MSAKLDSSPKMDTASSENIELDAAVLKMLTELATTQDKQPDYQDREYQLFLVELAKRKNIIACLPTGSGKTFIALLLAKHFLPEAIQTNRKIVFLANTVPLVNQQAEYFRRHLSNQFIENSKQVECLTGDRQVDYWEPKKWEVVLDGCNVLVMTTQIFVDALGHGYINFSDVIFLILDECHHTDKDAPMNKVMEEYRDILSRNSFKLDLKQLPRILGLTATIINGKGKKCEVAKEVMDAEERLCAKAVTYHKYEDVLKHSTCATVEYVLYNATHPDRWSPLIANPLRNFLAMIMNSNKELFAEKLPDICHSSFKGDDQRYNSKESDCKALKSMVKEVLDVFTDLGPYCAKIAAIHKRAYIQTKNLDDVDNVYVGFMLKALDTALAIFICQVERLMGKLDEAAQVQTFVTDKISKLMEILKGYDPQDSNKVDEKLCGLIFVQQRITAQALTWYLEDAARTPAYKFIIPGFVVGSATYGLDPNEARITANEQAEVIRRFRSKDFNLLVATKVLEEGLDVPACNLVVRFDKVHTYPSYVQSMGRARNKNSKFYGFIDQAEEKSQKEQYEYFQRYNTQLSDHLRQNAIHADEDDEDEVRTIPVDHIIPSFEPNPGQCPRITALESISIAQRYCQTLPCDKLVTLSPVSWWEKVEPTGYRAHVQFPSNAVIRHIISGEVQETKMLAKRSAFLNACIELYKCNVLDDKLFPIPRRVNPLISNFLESVAKEQDSQGRKVGSNKRTQHYRKKVPDMFKTGRILPGNQCRVYEIRVDQHAHKEDRVSTSLYRFHEKKFVYCFITPVDLAVVPEFVLNVNPSIGNLIVRLKEIFLQENSLGVTLNSQEINTLQKFQRYMFGDLLKLKREIMRESDESSFLIAPLKREKDALPSIHWELISKLLAITGKFFEPPQEEVQRTYKFHADNYEDSVVIPWYRGHERHFYTVVNVSEDQTIESPFVVNKAYATYGKYFIEKYKSTVKFINDPNQMLLRAKLISGNLNFFKRDVSFKKSPEERKDQRDSIVELVPELGHIFPLPASLYIQSKLLPSVIQRIHRYLSAFDVQKLIAKDTPWTNVIEARSPCRHVWYEYAELIALDPISRAKDDNDNFRVGKDYQEEWRNLIYKNDPIDIEPTPAKQGKVLDHSTESMTNGTSVQVQQPLQALNSNSPIEAQLAEEAALAQEKFADNNNKGQQSHEPVLDFINPRNLSLSEITRIKDRNKGMNLKESRVKKSNGMKIDENDTRYDWKPEKKSSIVLIDPDKLDHLKYGSLDEKFEFSSKNQPTLYSLMQAITMEASLDSVTLERLETIGDSFLKYCVSRHIFSYFPKMDEGKMTQLRSALVSNAHLYSLGKKLKLGEYLAAGIFRPDCAWLPPSFRTPELLAQVAAENEVNDDVYLQTDTHILENLSHQEVTEFVQINKSKSISEMPANVGLTHSRISDKGVADCVEALIGAYFIHGGPGGALHFMEKLGLRGPTSDLNHKEGTAFGTWPTPVPVYEPGNDQVQNHHSLFKELEELICYKFKQPWLLVEAFSHPCYMKNRVTDCYQRLEFLGDAVLDFLITNHIYKSKVMTPGQLTDLRSALVNNVTFGSLSVRYGFETYLLHTDRKLQEAVDIFTEYQERADHEVTGHFVLLSDLDSHLVSDVDCPKVLGDIFESLAGAVYVDSGMSLDAVWRVFYRLMKNEIDKFSQNVPKSPVRELYESNPARKVFLDITEEAVKLGFKDPAMCYVHLTIPIKDVNGDFKPIIGVGKSKQNAKLAAAKYAVKLKRVIKQKELSGKHIRTLK